MLLLLVLLLLLLLLWWSLFRMSPRSSPPALSPAFVRASPTDAADLALVPLLPSWRFHSAAVTTTGSVRDNNQDRFCLQPLTLLPASSASSSSSLSSSVATAAATLSSAAAISASAPPSLLFGVFDGHGLLGDAAAQMCAAEIPDRLPRHLAAWLLQQQPPLVLVCLIFSQRVLACYGEFKCQS